MLGCNILKRGALLGGQKVRWYGYHPAEDSGLFPIVVITLTVGGGGGGGQVQYRVHFPTRRLFEPAASLKGSGEGAGDTITPQQGRREKTDLHKVMKVCHPHGGCIFCVTF